MGQVPEIKRFDLIWFDLNNVIFSTVRLLWATVRAWYMPSCPVHVSFLLPVLLYFWTYKWRWRWRWSSFVWTAALFLHCALSCAVYCNRPCLCVFVFVCLWVRLTTASVQCLRRLWALFHSVLRWRLKTDNSEVTWGIPV